ncbi:NADPH-dependent F420 reductase [Cellulomonas shaoxiangyii]|uniref:NADP oxidoreductase n=1 Tax=Cellulomonas shaoxiangyii TaxID=2566013 RepID=A0A4P7SF15_9CELL|nr:NADPH-dependent F420 reductase [Cellulomonas shaoxiangyii]QCB92450.1 NADP oxidoreductase [Cellulomonas shaoxiangyii]TGY85653.1 NADP oxidoreductase [Cellulomonas shaoxiangyii]
MTTIGFIGAGQIGSQLARLAVRHGFDVVVSNSRGPATLVDLVAELGDRARAGTPVEAAEAGDVVVVTIPLGAIGSVPVEPLAGKVVIDTTNYYPHRDGRVAELDDESTTTSELVQRHLPSSHVVKAFNHPHAAQLTTDGTAAGTPGRRAVAVAGDDAGARARVAAFVDEIGFDVVELSPLSEGWRVQRDTPAYDNRGPADSLRADLAAARRYRDM